VLLTVGAIAEDTLQANIDSFFVKLSTTFDRIAANPVIKKKQVSIIDQFFLTQLRRHQVIWSLTRTDEKGISRTEYVRMKDANHEKQDFKKEPWFAQLAKGEESFQGIVKDTGRYYLIWSKPIILAGRQNKIAGAVMMKIDLWDCFQAISRKTDKPFLVYLKKMRFYDQKWDKTYEYRELPLTVPGAGSMTLRVQKDAIVKAPAPETTKVAPPPAVKSPDTSAALAASKAKEKKKPTLNAKIGILIGIAVAAILLVLITVLISWIKNQMIIRSINKGL
jgi:hypothetical protein